MYCECTKENIIYSVPAKWAGDVPLGDPACSWEEDVGGAQSLEAVEASESYAIVGMLRDGETDSGDAFDVELYQE